MSTLDQQEPLRDPHGLPRILADVGNALASQSELRWVYVFGSAARGEPFRDLDVAIRALPGTFPTLRALGGLARRIAAASRIADLAVDVFDLEQCPLPMIDEILTDGVVVLDRSPADRRVWEAEVNSRWLDFKPVWERQLRLRRAG